MRLEMNPRIAIIGCGLIGCGIDCGGQDAA